VYHWPLKGFWPHESLWLFVRLMQRRIPTKLLFIIRTVVYYRLVGGVGQGGVLILCYSKFTYNSREKLPPPPSGGHFPRTKLPDIHENTPRTFSPWKIPPGCQLYYCTRRMLKELLHEWKAYAVVTFFSSVC